MQRKEYDLRNIYQKYSSKTPMKEHSDCIYVYFEYWNKVSNRN